MGHFSDAELVSLARQGNYDAFEQLVSRHEQRLYGTARRILGDDDDAQEAVQETFLIMLQKLEQFRGTSAFGTWLTRIAINSSLQILRRRQREQTFTWHPSEEDDFEIPEFIASWKAGPRELAERGETAALLREAIESLDEKHRVVFVLRDVEGMDTAETATALGLSESNVKVRLLRARLALREKLTAKLGDPARRVSPPHVTGSPPSASNRKK